MYIFPSHSDILNIVLSSILSGFRKRLKYWEKLIFFIFQTVVVGMILALRRRFCFIELFVYFLCIGFKRSKNYWLIIVLTVVTRKSSRNLETYTAINKTTQGRTCRYICVCVCVYYIAGVRLIILTRSSCCIYVLYMAIESLALLRLSNGSDRIGCSFLFPVSRAFVYFHDNFLWRVKHKSSTTKFVCLLW